jgi:hypothetical protein
MRQAPRVLFNLISALIVCAIPSFGTVKMRLTECGPIVDDVYINGHGPFRFLVDTGSNTNLIASELARRIGLKTTFRTSFASLDRERVALGSARNEISLDSVRAAGQELLLADMNGSLGASTGIQGIIGQKFLALFDYLLDLKGKRFSLGEHGLSGTRSQFHMINGRPAVSTSLGRMVLDSGAGAVVIAAEKLVPAAGRTGMVRSAAGRQQVALKTERLVIEGRAIWEGEAIAITGPLDPGVDGLLPLKFFKSVYVCNSGGYIVFE